MLPRKQVEKVFSRSKTRKTVDIKESITDMEINDFVKVLLQDIMPDEFIENKDLSKWFG